MATTSKRRVANPIAVRRYAVVGEPDREVVLTIGKPRTDPQPGGDWMCSVLIEGIPGERRRRIHGADAVQSLQLAMRYARQKLDASGLSLTWLDGEPGDLAFHCALRSGGVWTSSASSNATCSERKRASPAPSRLQRRRESGERRAVRLLDAEVIPRR